MTRAIYSMLLMVILTACTKEYQWDNPLDPYQELILDAEANIEVYSHDQIILSWTLTPITEAIIIERGPAGSDSWEKIARVVSPEDTYIDTSVSSSSRYDYRIIFTNRAANRPDTSFFDIETPPQQYLLTSNTYRRVDIRNAYTTKIITTVTVGGSVDELLFDKASEHLAILHRQDSLKVISFPDLDHQINLRLVNPGSWGDITMLVWSADGQQMFYVDRTKLMRVDLDAQETIQVYNFPTNISKFTLTSTGDQAIVALSSSIYHLLNILGDPVVGFSGEPGWIISDVQIDPNDTIYAIMTPEPMTIVRALGDDSELWRGAYGSYYYGKVRFTSIPDQILITSDTRLTAMHLSNSEPYYSIEFPNTRSIHEIPGRRGLVGSSGFSATLTCFNLVTGASIWTQNANGTLTSYVAGSDLMGIGGYGDIGCLDLRTGNEVSRIAFYWGYDAFALSREFP